MTESWTFSCQQSDFKAILMSYYCNNAPTISMAILLPSTDSRKVDVSYKQKYVHKVLVNCLVKLAQEKSVVR